MRKSISCVLFFLILFFLASEPANAQCAMCKAITQSNSGSGFGSVVDGLNGGILYLMAIPYVMLTLLGILFFRKSFLAKARKNQ